MNPSIPTPIAIAVVEHEGQFLIGQRPAGKALAGLWEFPGGRIEPGETADRAAERECLEETGLQVTAVGSYPHCRHEYAHDRVQLHFVSCRLTVSCSLTSSAESIPEPFRWVRREELSVYRFPAGNRELLELLLKGR